MNEINLKRSPDNFEPFHSQENTIDVCAVNRKILTRLLSEFTMENQGLNEYLRIRIMKKMFMLTLKRFCHTLMASQRRDIRSSNLCGRLNLGVEKHRS